MPVDLATLWDFSRPDVSEVRFVSALDGATTDDRLILQTQIARTHGLRRDFDRALAVLRGIAPDLAAASPEAQARHALERGRARVSAAHVRRDVTAADRDAARADYRHAAEVARAAGLDALAVDALHMLAVVDDAPADQLRWNREALALAIASPQPDARRWEAPLRNNLGLALHATGDLPGALAEFEQAHTLRARGTNAGATRVAAWMVAWTLRGLGRTDEALAQQEQLREACEAAGAPDPFVFDELVLLYEALGRSADAAVARARRQALGS
jgi:tetratricopeptide (TPR) repeat protein